MPVEPTGATGTTKFLFDMAEPFYEQVADAFQTVQPVPLSVENITTLPRKPGVYGLLLDDELVYVGKADKNVQDRLSKHRWRIRGRVGLDPDRVSFKAVILDETWDTFKPESRLIDIHDPDWNHSGFGMNVPGRQRQFTSLKDDHWHVRYPCDPDWPCYDISTGTVTAYQLAKAVRESAPYWVSVQGFGKLSRPEEKAAKDELEANWVQVPEAGMTVTELLTIIAEGTPSTWQITHIPSNVLLYQEQDIQYPRGTILYP